MNFHDWPWQPEPDHTRLLRTLRREGDARHVPVLELFADMEVIDHALGEPPVSLHGAVRDVIDQLTDRKIRFWHRLGYDAFWQGPITGFQFARLESADTAEVRKTHRTWVNEGVGLIASMSDFEQYPWPKPEQVDYYPMESAARQLPEGMAIIAQVPGTLEHAMWLMGYETFALALYEQPELIEAVFAKIEEISLPVSRTLAQMDRVMALWMGDDMRIKTATMIAPKDLRKHVFPIQKQIAAIAHAQGLPFMLHACGNLLTGSICTSWRGVREGRSPFPGTKNWGYGAVGSALPWPGRGQGFESP